MSLNANNLPSKSSSGPRPDPVEEGTYPARLVQVFLLGTQKQRAFKGEEKPPVLTLRVTYELLDEFLKDENGEDREDKPRWISEEFAFHSLKADLAKSTKRYYALDPKEEAGGDWSKLLGAPCMVTITHSKGKDDRIYENVAGVSTMRDKEAQKAPELKNPTRMFDFYNPDKEVFDSFPDWLKDRIKDAVDYEGGALEELLSGGSKKATTKTTVKEDLDGDGVEGEDW